MSIPIEVGQEVFSALSLAALPMTRQEKLRFCRYMLTMTELYLGEMTLMDDAELFARLSRERIEDEILGGGAE